MSLKTFLIINCGSSSVKFQVFDADSELVLLAKGAISNLGSEPVFHFSQDNSKINLAADTNHEQAIQFILDKIKIWDLQAVAHRVVHGGELFTQSVVVNPEIIQQLKQLIPLAPLHQPHNLAAIEIVKKLHPDLIQIACFDTAFHAHHTPLFKAYALPKNLRDQGIRRYGFHGLSFEWLAHVMRQDHPQLASGRVIAAHLGNGASLCAMSNGVSIDTTMGLTALDGLPMGTRCGGLDPGAVLYMIRELGLPVNEVEQILYTNSGLLGLSGISNDVELLEKSNEEQAQFALSYFSLKTAQYIGMMAIALGGVDAIIFTGGIGENAQSVRAEILKRIQCLQDFSTLVLPANEEKMMAMHALSLLGLG